MAEWKELQLKEDKYTDAEAVAAVLADDAYVKNTGDTMTGNLGINTSIAVVKPLTLEGAAGVAHFPSMRIQHVCTSIEEVVAVVEFGGVIGGTWDRTSFIGTGSNIDKDFLIAQEEDASIIFRTNAIDELELLSGGKLDMKSNILKDPKNHTHSALSGTKKLVEIDIGGTSYYFEVHPTKA